MRAKLTFVALLVAALGLVAGAAPSSGGEPYIVNVVKAVDGDGPVGPYGVNVTCTNEFAAPAGPFDFTIDDGETVSLAVNFNDECTVTETDELGADSVTYACEEVVEATCVDDRTVAIDQNDSEGEGTVTITNGFEPDVAPDDDVDPIDDVVPATPTFTG